MAGSYFLRNKILVTIGLAYLSLLALNALGLHVWLPPCLITLYTGHQCFGCGLNRAAIHLLQGNPGAAFHSNALIFIYIPLLIGYFAFDYYSFHKKIEQPS